MAASFLTIIIDWIGADQIQKWIQQLQLYYKWDTVKVIGNGEWTVYMYDPKCTDDKVCNKIIMCGSSFIFDDNTGPDFAVCKRYPCEKKADGTCKKDEKGQEVVDKKNVKYSGWAY